MLDLKSGITFVFTHQQYINASFTPDFQESGSLLILLLKGSKVIRLTVSVLLRVARSGVNGRSFRITFETDQKVIRSNVNRA